MVGLPHRCIRIEGRLPSAVAPRIFRTASSLTALHSHQSLSPRTFVDPRRQSSGCHGLQMRHRRPANVGKSTLFNALTRTAAAQAANYPFCTIEPNTGEVAVPDPRLERSRRSPSRSRSSRPASASSTSPGLVRGASKGEGLGNQFLANIREVDAIVHVLRCFEDERHHPCRGPHRPGRRCRDGQDRADARRPRQPGAPRRTAPQEARPAATRKRRPRWR